MYNNINTNNVKHHPVLALRHYFGAPPDPPSHPHPTSPPPSTPAHRPPPSYVNRVPNCEGGGRSRGKAGLGLPSGKELDYFFLLVFGREDGCFGAGGVPEALEVIFD